MNRVTFDFTGTTALVTGGTSGIGHAIALAFRQAGATVHVTGTRSGSADYQTDLQDLAYHQLEMADAAGVEALGHSFDLLDVLVNNAGMNFPGGRDEWIPDVFEAALTINLSSHLRLTMACQPALEASRAAGGACVVNLASMSAMRAVPIVPGYSSAKAGVVALTRNLADRWASRPIRVNAIAPGVIDTPMTAPMAGIPELIDEQLSHIPMGRFGTVEEVASVALFLCTEQASYLTGHPVVVDGGYAVR